MIYVDFNELMQNKTVNGKPLNMLRLSKETGISRTTLYNLKQGKGKGIEYPTLNTLVQYFSVPVGKILKYSNENVNIDLYDYSHFYNKHDLKDFYNRTYHDLMNDFYSVHNKKDIKENESIMKNGNKKIAYGMTIAPMKQALYIQYTFKNEKFIETINPIVIGNKNTINPKIESSISEGMVAPTAFAKKNDDKQKIQDKFMKQYNYFQKKILRHLPYNQHLFLLCRAIQFNHALDNKISTMKVKKQDRNKSTIKDNEGLDKRKNITQWNVTNSEQINHITKNTKFILRIFNARSNKEYRMSRNRILNYKQPSHTDFNSNIYNFIIRDHTKE